MKRNEALPIPVMDYSEENFLNKMKLPVECEVGIKMSSEDKALERQHRCMLLLVCPHLHGTELVFLDPR